MASMVEATLPTILCCMCATPIKANAANMCVSCLKSQVDITDGIPKEVIIHQCRGCLKWSRPPWAVAELESRELLAICLKKINNLNKVKLIDANWVWTEPHSKRLKLKLTVQKEVLSKMILQQSFIVTFIVRNQQCDDCQRVFANQSWRAVVQVRQRVDHKRTFFFLEQLILKHRAHEKASSIESHPNGVDFFFVERNHALRFVDFLQECVPIKLKYSKKLISADNHSNTHNYKFSYMVDIAPVCKDDLVVLPLKLARLIGNISCLVLVQSVSSSIHVVDPFTTQTAEIDNDKYWRYPFRAIRSIKQMTAFTVLDATPMAIPIGGGKPIRTSRKTRLAEMDVVRDVDFGVNDQRFATVCHLANLFHVGDHALGYDLTTAVFNDNDLEPMVQAGLTFPDVVLVKKQYPRRVQKRTRNWKLKKIEGIVDEDEEEIAGHGKKSSSRKQQVDQSKDAMDYEQFLDDLEEDKDMRAQINLYKDERLAKTTSGGTKKKKMSKTTHASDDAAMDEDEDEEDDEEEEGDSRPAIALDELLDDLTMNDQEDDDDGRLLTATEANAVAAWELEEL